jgi:hypothetical protein
MPTLFIDPWGTVVPGGDIEPTTLIGRLAVHKSGDIAPIIQVDQTWPGIYMLSIGNEEGYLTDRKENFYIYEAS